MGNTRNTGYLQNIVQYDASNNVILPSLTGTGSRMVISSSTGVLSAQDIPTLSALGGVPTSRTLTIDGVSYDLSSNRTWTILPTGGAAGQLLAKSSATNYATEWIDNYTSEVKHYVKLAENMSIGTAVYVSGSTGQAGTNMLVSKASNASEGTSSKTLGLVAFTGVTNDIGFVVTEGLLEGLDTSTAGAVGDPVWLGVNGALIFGLANKPIAPAHLVFIGVVTRKQQNNGEIFVKVQNGFEFGELHDYVQTGVLDNYVISYESSTSLYKPKSIATLLGYTPANAARTITINGTSYDLSADRSWTINSMIYPGAGIAVSTGTAWGTSLTDNSSNWNTAYGWGNHASAGYATTTYVGTQIANLVASSPATLDTLNELAAALGNDAAFSTTVSTALGNRLRVDINTQGLSATLQGYGRTNLGLGTAATSNTGDFAAASHTHSIANVTGLQTALDGKQASGSYAAATHSHIISDVTGLQTALDGKQASLGFTPYNSTNPSGYISSYTETDTLATVTGRGASTSSNVTFSGITRLGTSGYSTYINGGLMFRDYGNNSLTNGRFYYQDDAWHFRGGGEGEADVTSDTAMYIRSGNVERLVLHEANISSYAVPTSRTITINGTALDLSANRSFTVTASETDTLATVTGRGASTTAAITISREAFGYGGTTQSFLIDGAGGNGALTINAASAYAYLTFAQAGVSKFEIGAEGAATNKGSLYFNHNVQVGSTGASLYLKKSNGYVGINQTNPTYQLHVNTDANEGIFLKGSGAGVWMNIQTTGKLWSIGAQTDGMGIYQRTDSAYALFITDGGFLSIGNGTTATYKFNVYTDADVWHAAFGSSTGQLRIGGATGSGAVIQSYTPAGVTRALYLQRDGSYAVFGGTTNTTLGGFTSTKVGIKQLADGGSGGGLHIEQASNENIAFFGFTGSAFRIGTSYRTVGAYQPIEFTTNAATRLFIQTNGNIGIGNTDPGALLHVSGKSYIGTMTSFNPAVEIRGGYYGAARLQIYGLDSDANAHMGLVTDMGAGAYELSIFYSDVSGSRIAFGRHNGGNGTRYSGFTVTATLSYGGTFTAAGDVVAYGSPSDARLKTIKEKIPNALEKISKLNGYRFDWNKIDSLTKLKEDVGVIAQEVEKVLPELARTNDDGTMSVRYQGLTAVLIEAVKEQQTQIESQKSEIDELKDLVKQLINR